MADKYTKIVAPSTPEVTPPADAWKDSQVEKEVQPAKVKSTLTYRQLEAQVASLDKQIDAIKASKAETEAEMIKVKETVEN